MTRYTILFEVEILHDYFLNRGGIVYEALTPEQQTQVIRGYTIHDFLAIAPTTRTKQVLAGHQMLLKATQTGFFVAAKLDPATSTPQPIIPVSSDFHLAFALQISDPRFFNYTALPSASPSFYQFSNHSENVTPEALFLSRSVPGFNASRWYEASEVYSQNSGGVTNLFRALRDTVPSATPTGADWERIPADTFDTSLAYTRDSLVLANNRLYRALVNNPGDDLNNVAEWQLVSTLANQYVTIADSVVVMPAMFNLDLREATLSQATIRIVRTAVDAIAWENHYQVESGHLTMVPLDLRNLLSGGYRLQVLDGNLAELPALGFTFYLDEQAVRDRWFGVLEIYPGRDSMALLDNSGHLRIPHPRYCLRFLNRATRWRYHFPAEQIIGSGSEVVPDPDDNRILTTPLPRPLTYWASRLRLQADNAGTTSVSEEVLLPNPGSDRIRRQNAQWYSEIYLSNLPL